MNSDAKPKQRNPNSLVILCGLCTIAISLTIVYLLGTTEFNIMGWFLFFIIPAGAMFAGAVAGSGYYIGCKLLNTKIRGVFLVRIFFLSIIAYVASYFIVYITFANAELVSFYEFIKFYAEGLSFGENEKPLGAWGWLFMGLECLGFALGSALPVLMLSNTPYCDRCRYFLKKQENLTICSPNEKADLKKKKAPEKEQIIIEAINYVTTHVFHLQERTQGATLHETLGAIAQLPKSQNKKALATSRIELLKCPACDTHSITANLTNVTTDSQINATELFSQLNEA